MITNLYQSFLKFSETPYRQEPFDSVKISTSISLMILITYRPKEIKKPTAEQSISLSKSCDSFTESRGSLHFMTFLHLMTLSNFWISGFCDNYYVTFVDIYLLTYLLNYDKIRHLDS